MTSKTQPHLRGLPVIWTAHIKSPEARKKFEESVKHMVATPVGERLIAILDLRLSMLSKDEASYPRDYDNPSWSHKQAHRNGVRQALMDVLQLLADRETPASTLTKVEHG